MTEDVKLMKGNEAIAHAAIRYGADGYFGYPITPQSEIMETLMELKRRDDIIFKSGSQFETRRYFIYCRSRTSLPYR